MRTFQVHLECYFQQRFRVLFSLLDHGVRVRVCVVREPTCSDKEDNSSFPCLSLMHHFYILGKDGLCLIPQRWRVLQYNETFSTQISWNHQFLGWVRFPNSSPVGSVVITGSTLFPKTICYWIQSIPSTPLGRRVPFYPFSHRAIGSDRLRPIPHVPTDPMAQEVEAKLWKLWPRGGLEEV